MRILPAAILLIVTFIGLAQAHDLSPQHSAASSTSSNMVVAKLLKYSYCILCTSGSRHNCDAPMGGKSGRAWCASRRVVQCPSAGGIVVDHGC